MGTAAKHFSISSWDRGQDCNLHLKDFGATKNYIFNSLEGFFPLQTYWKGLLNNELSSLLGKKIMK